MGKKSPLYLLLSDDLHCFKLVLFQSDRVFSLLRIVVRFSLSPFAHDFVA